MANRGKCRALRDVIRQGTDRDVDDDTSGIRGCKASRTGPCSRTVAEQPGLPSGQRDLISLEDIIADLRLLRERGLVRIRHTELAALRLAADRTPLPPPGEAGPRAVEALLRTAVENLGEGSLAAAAAHTFGLNRGARDRPAQDRRRRAAQEYGVSVERFRKHHERVVIEQVAEEILKLCQPAAGRADPAMEPAELASATTLEGRAGNAEFLVTVHVEPVELLRDVDVIVVPTNTYLEMPQPYKASVSAAIRRAAALRTPDGTILTDSVLDELRAWIRDNGRPGMPVTAGTVVVTSAGALGQQGVRRIYHAAIVSPRPGTNDYDVDPAVIGLAVRNAFAIAKSERDRFRPPLKSLVFPLLGSGRGGLDPAVSFAWIWATVQREISEDAGWDIHFVTRWRATADVILAGLSQGKASPPKC
jgi:O-acetyl-ADP-ribose deacetylase (regulator of RNase III)